VSCCTALGVLFHDWRQERGGGQQQCLHGFGKVCCLTGPGRCRWVLRKWWLADTGSGTLAGCWCCRVVGTGCRTVVQGGTGCRTVVQGGTGCCTAVRLALAAAGGRLIRAAALQCIGRGGRVVLLTVVAWYTQLHSGGVATAAEQSDAWPVALLVGWYPVCTVPRYRGCIWVCICSCVCFGR
jgi:hypothetical protein